MNCFMHHNTGDVVCARDRVLVGGESLKRSFEYICFAKVWFVEPRHLSACAKYFTGSPIGEMEARWQLNAKVTLNIYKGLIS